MRKPDPYALTLTAILAVALFALIGASAEATGNPQVCPGTHLAPGETVEGAHGTIDSGADGVSYDLNEGWTATICVKAGSAKSGGGTHTETVTGTGSIAAPGGHDLSHWSLTLEYTPPPSTTEPTTTTTEPTTTTTEPEPSTTTTTSTPPPTTTPPTTTTTTPPSTTTTTPPPPTSPTTSSSTSTTNPAPPTTATPPDTTDRESDDEPPAELPRTGASTAGLAAAAAALLVAGGTTVIATPQNDYHVWRRRRWKVRGQGHRDWEVSAQPPWHQRRSRHHVTPTRYSASHGTRERGPAVNEPDTPTDGYAVADPDTEVPDLILDVVRHNRTTVATLTLWTAEIGTREFRGSAIRHPDDDHSVAIGDGLAITRALEGAAEALGDITGDRIRHNEIRRDLAAWKAAQARTGHILELLTEVDETIHDLETKRERARSAAGRRATTKTELMRRHDEPLDDDQAARLLTMVLLSETDDEWNTAIRHRQILEAKLTKSAADEHQLRHRYEAHIPSPTAGLIWDPETSHIHPESHYEPDCPACANEIERI